MFGLDKTWQLDPRLKGDTFEIRQEDDMALLLMNDARWPWVIAVPKVVGAEELHDIKPGYQGAIMERCVYYGQRLKAHTQCEKINIAAIGNSVRQLHIHIIARSEGDPNWPGPVWGFGKREAYAGAQGRDLAQELKEVFRVSLFH
ncbi:MAG: HIT family protein [Pseudomonadota bacterium]